MAQPPAQSARRASTTTTRPRRRRVRSAAPASTTYATDTTGSANRHRVRHAPVATRGGTWIGRARPASGTARSALRTRSQVLGRRRLSNLDQLDRPGALPPSERGVTTDICRPSLTKRIVCVSADWFLQSSPTAHVHSWEGGPRAFPRSGYGDSAAATFCGNSRRDRG